MDINHSKYLVVGNPIEHSLSPKLHNRWIEEKNIKAIYEKKQVEKYELKNLIGDIRDKKISGINVTVPHKKDIIPYLDDLSLEAKKTQSVNTVFYQNNKVIGHNTDIYGFKKSIESIKFDITNKTVLILGAGGVVPSIVYALNKMNVSKIILSNRTKNKAESLKKIFNFIDIVDWGNLPDFDIIINATSLGLKKEDEIGLDFSKIGKNKLFYDVIYNPGVTNFLNSGEQSGNITENGKMMFIYQAFEAFKIWHNTEPAINDALIKFLEK